MGAILVFDPVGPEPPATDPLSVVKASLIAAPPLRSLRGTAADASAAPSPSADSTAAVKAGVDNARGWAEKQEGYVSFAVVGEDGEVRGYREGAAYPSASIVKAMLLAAETHRLADSGEPLDSSTDALLRAMITYSDNDAATTIYGRVGDAGMNAMAERADMKGFDVAASWGYATVTAADMARLFASLDELFPKRHEKYAKGLLGSIIPAQSWGIPDAAKEGWQIRFKGGWRITERGQLVHQAAELRRDAEHLAIAVLTDGQPSMDQGISIVEGVTDRLLRADRSPSRQESGKTASLIPREVTRYGRVSRATKPGQTLEKCQRGTPSLQDGPLDCRSPLHDPSFTAASREATRR